MLSTGLDLKTFAILADDGKIGHAEDFLFDDKSWLIRWIVVQTGSWLSGRKVLIHPDSIAHVDHGAKTIRVTLSMAKVKASPDISTDEPVSRQMQYSLYGYYGYDPYWGGGIYPGGLGFIPPHTRATALSPTCSRRATARAIPTCAASAPSPATISRPQMARSGTSRTSSSTSRPGRLPISPSPPRIGGPANTCSSRQSQLQKIIWLEAAIDLTLTREMIRQSPPWRPGDINFPAYQALLHDHYGWPPTRMAAA